MHGNMNAILLVVGLYLGAGVLFALAFVVRGVARVDPAAAGSSWGFRVMIIPGVATLWPLMALRWRRVSGSHQPRSER